MDFSAPERLWLLAAAAALTVAYLAVQWRRRRDAARFADPALLPLLTRRRAGGWRHALAGLFLAGVVLATVGAAGPTMPGIQQRERATVIVAMDVSDSMAATDVAPDRITAAVAAAQAFVDDLPAAFDVGLVSFAASAVLVVPLTADHRAVRDALDGLLLSPGTALGEAIFTALAALPPDPTGPPDGSRGPGEEPAPAASIVLLSDGLTTTGRPDEEAVAAAVEAGVPVSTIAFGTDDPTVTVESAGHTVAVPVDASAMQAIAEGTGGTFFTAATPDELRQVYDDIEAAVTFVSADQDLAEWFAGAALLLLAAAVVLSMLSAARVVWT